MNKVEAGAIGAIIGAVLAFVLVGILAISESSDSEAVTQFKNKEWFQSRATVFNASDGTKCIAIAGDFAGLACDFK